MPGYGIAAGAALTAGGLVLLAGSVLPAWANTEASLHSWSASTQGPALHGRGVRAMSEPIEPAGYLTQSSGVVTRVRWRYSFTRTPPRELQAYLCNPTRCVLLGGAEGQTDAFGGDDAARGFVFAFRVPGQGALAPVLQGGANQVTVSYR